MKFTQAPLKTQDWFFFQKPWYHGKWPQLSRCYKCQDGCTPFGGCSAAQIFIGEKWQRLVGRSLVLFRRSMCKEGRKRGTERDFGLLVLVTYPNLTKFMTPRNLEVGRFETADGRDERKTAKSYASTFKRLFEEDRKVSGLSDMCFPVEFCKVEDLFQLYIFDHFRKQAKPQMVPSWI